MLKKKSTKNLVHPEGSVETTVAPDHTTGKEKKKRKPKERKQGEKLPLQRVIKSRPFVGGVCIILALLLAFVVTPLLQMKLAQTVEVVVLKQPVAAGTRITADMLKVIETGASTLPLGAINQTENAVGKYVCVAGMEGDVLTAARLSEQFPSDDPELSHLPEGKMAMSASLTELAQSLSGKLRPGDIIRLYATLEQENAASGDYAAIPIPELQYVEVLAVTNPNARDVSNQSQAVQMPDGGQSTSESERQIATVTLAVNQEQAAVLAGLEQNAVLHAALAVRGDAEAKQAALDAQQVYFEQSIQNTGVDKKVQPAVDAKTAGQGAVAQGEGSGT